MNTLEAEYSFLAPTWRLPPVATPSMYSRTYGSSSYLPSTSELSPDWPLWSNTMYNSRYRPPYVPSTTVRRNYPISTNYQPSVPFNYPPEQHNYQLSNGRTVQSDPSSYQQTNNLYGANINPDDGLDLTISLHPRNEYDSYNHNHNNNNNENKSNNYSRHGQSQHQTMNRGLTYATNPPAPVQPPQKRRVQIVDHNRQTPSTVGNGYISGRSSHNSNHTNTHSQHNQTPDASKYHQKPRPPVSNQHHNHTDDNRSNYHASTGNIHDYLYGPSAPDSGGYSTAYKNQQRRLQDEKLGRKSVMSEYKTFAQNGGFGPTFGNVERHKYDEKVDTDKKKKSYSKTVRATNQYKIEEQKRVRSQYNQEKNRPAPVAKYQRAKEYADKIERPHHLKPVVRLRDPTSGNVIVRDEPHHHRHRLSS